MRIRTTLAALAASFFVAGAAQAAVVTYAFSGSGSGDLAGAAFADRAFDLVLTGDTDIVNDFGLLVFEISPLQSATVRIDGLADAVLTSPSRLGINRLVNIIYFGPTFGPDYLDLQVSDADEMAFTFAAPYGPVSGAANSFGQFVGVGTSQGALTFSSVAGVTFRAVAGTVPEPATWAMMIMGLGGVGAMLRRRPREQAHA
jgi:hypothetical protein